MASDNGGHHSRVSDVPPDTVAAPEVLPKRCPCGQLIGMDASTQATFWKVCREVSVQCSLQRMPPLPLPTEVSHQPSELLTGNEVPDSPRKDNTAQLFAVNNTSSKTCTEPWATHHYHILIGYVLQNKGLPHGFQYCNVPSFAVCIWVGIM